jgi:methanogen homoaconitase small subunit
MEAHSVTQHHVRIWKFGDAINTDDILPGKYAPLMVGEKDYPQYAFAHLRPEFAASIEPGDVLVGGENWGLGSSREYAPRALKRLGVSAIIAHSFARIHYRNLVNLGIPAFVAPAVVSALADGDRIHLDLTQGVLRRDAAIFDLPAPNDFLAAIFEAGSLMEYVRKHHHLPGQSDP